MAATVKKMKGLTFERPCDKSKSSHKGIKRIFKELSPADWAVADKKTKKKGHKKKRPSVNFPLVVLGFLIGILFHD